MSYHKNEIPKGVVGQFSKIQEEYLELEDAYQQGDKILQLCELSDLIGAIDLYTKTVFNMSLSDLISFSNKTMDAFKENKR